MRTVIQISAAFLVLDGRDKSPLREASVLVDGGRRRCFRKGDGHIVFTDLPAVEHTFEIQGLPQFVTAAAPVIAGEQHFCPSRFIVLVEQHGGVSAAEGQRLL